MLSAPLHYGAAGGGGPLGRSAESLASRVRAVRSTTPPCPSANAAACAHGQEQREQTGGLRAAACAGLPCAAGGLGHPPSPLPAAGPAVPGHAHAHAPSPWPMPDALPALAPHPPRPRHAHHPLSTAPTRPPPHTHTGHPSRSSHLCLCLEAQLRGHELQRHCQRLVRARNAGQPQQPHLRGGQPTTASPQAGVAGHEQRAPTQRAGSTCRERQGRRLVACCPLCWPDSVLGARGGGRGRWEGRVCSSTDAPQQRRGRAIVAAQLLLLLLHYAAAHQHPCPAPARCEFTLVASASSPALPLLPLLRNPPAAACGP